jgi:peroxiredoxin
MQRALRIAGLALLMASILAPAAAIAGELTVGSKVPDFTLTDINGKTHSLSDYEGKIVVLEWTNPQCPFVRNVYANKVMSDLDAFCKENGVVHLGVDSSHYVTAEAEQKWAESHDIKNPILLDPSGAVGKEYGAKTTPHMFVIGKNGDLLYSGAIDDNPKPSGRGETNYVKNALKAALAGKAVEVTHEKPYGCSVKYAKGT